MTNADQAWSDDAPSNGPAATLSLGLSGSSRTVASQRRARTDVADAADLAEQVRARVRDLGVDPQRDTDAVRRIAEGVAQAHDERSLTGAVAPLDDLPALVDDLVSRVSGFGPLQRYLDDPAVARACQVVTFCHDPTRGAVLPAVSAA